MTSRTIELLVKGVATTDGGGVRLLRSIASRKLDSLDPFLLLDEFKSDTPDDYIAGFPDHPHRGFETVTYMLAGFMEHRDHLGNYGLLSPGSVQWMTAGRGIVHSEMPRQENGLMWGFQLWVNLPAKDKMCKPRYQDIPPENVPVVTLDNGTKIRVIAGRAAGLEGPIKGISTEPTYIDVHMPPNTYWTSPIDEDSTAFVYVFAGDHLFVGPKETADLVNKNHLAVLSSGSQFEAQTTDCEARFLLVSGKPINEPIARSGPFVMNTREEIRQAFVDYQNGVLQQP